MGTKRFIEIVPTATITPYFNTSEQIRWHGKVKFKLRDNLRIGLWSYDVKQKDLDKLGLTKAEYDLVSNMIYGMNVDRRNSMTGNTRENLLADIEGYLKEVEEIFQINFEEETITFAPVARLEQG